MRTRAQLRPLAAALLAVGLASACDACDGERLGELVPLITPSADALALGPTYVGASDARSFSLRSSGTAAVELRAVRLEGDPSLTLSSSGAGVLAPGQSKELEVAFTPVAPGAFTATLVVESDADNDPELRVAVTALALAPAACDDDNACTSEVFDPALGSCVTTFLSGSCDDGSSCTTDDRCLEGACVGSAVLCEAANACERGVCANDEGCLSVPDPDACDDENPCTLDSCDALDGCGYEPVADGTPCAPPSGCEEARVCLSGECVAVAVPDGTPCNDGDLCTVADECESGVCGGERVEREPEVVGTLYTYGAAEGAAVVLDDGTLLFRDAASHGDKTVVSSVTADATGLEATRHLPLDGSARAWPLVALSGGRALVIAGLPYAAVVVERQAGGELVERGRVALSATTSPRFLAPRGDLVYGCGYSDLLVLDVSDPAAPIEVGEVAEPVGALCAGLAVDDAGDRLFLSRSTGGLWSFDLASPAAPVEQPGSHAIDLLVAPLAVEGGVLAAYESDAAHPEGFAGGPPVAGGRLWLRSTDTLAALGEIPVDPERRVAWLGFTPAGLVVAHDEVSTVRLELWDVADPTSPVLLDEALAWSEGGLASAHARGDLLVATSGYGSAAVFRITPSGLLQRLRGPTLGVVERVARRDDGVVSFGRDAVRAIALADPASPSVSAASTLPFSSSVVSFGAGRTPPTWLATKAHFDVLTTRWGTTLGTWLDASDVAAPAAVGSASFPLSAFRSGISTGSAIYLVSRATGDDAFAFEVIPLDDLAGGFELTLVAAGTLPLPFESTVDPIFGSVAVDPVARRAAVAVSDHEQGGTDLALVDLTDPTAPALLAHAWRDELAVLGLGVAGDIIVATAMRDGGAYQSYSAGRLLVLAASPDGELIDLGEVALPAGVGHLLAFDGRTAFVAARTGVVFVDVSDAPSVIGAVQTSAPVIEAAFSADHLVVSEESALETVSPPCPPLP